MKYKKQYFKFQYGDGAFWPINLGWVHCYIMAARWYRDENGSIVVSHLPNFTEYLKGVNDER